MSISNKKTLFVIGLLILSWLILLYIESSQQPLKIFGEIPGLDKVAHFSAYCILAVMLLALLNIINQYKKIPVLPLVLVLVILAGLFDEAHQAFVPGRNSDYWDLMADFCGALFAIMLNNKVARFYGLKIIHR